MDMASKKDYERRDLFRRVLRPFDETAVEVE